MTVPGPVAVIGLGLMGGSLARALKALPDPPDVFGVDRDPVAGAMALEAGVVDRFDPSGDGVVREAAVIVYAVPLRQALELVSDHAPSIRPTALVTDVASLNSSLVRRAHESGLGDRFVGSHPMAGGTEGGFGAARADLYDGTRIWLSAGLEVESGARERAESLWRALGGEPAWIDADEHDRMMAWASHLPQLVANALAGALDAAGFSPADLGPGGRGMVRLAGSSPELWRDLLVESAPATGAGLTSVSRALHVLADLLARREVDRIEEFMARTRRWVRNEPGDGDRG